MSFSQQVTTFGPKTIERINVTRRGVTIKLLGAVVRDTPVDEGTARANWQLTEGQPAQGTVDKSARSNSALTETEIAQVNASTGDVAIYLTNNLPYIGKLEYGGYRPGNDIKPSKGGSKVNSAGFSKKAPNGMVRKNVVRFGTLITIQVANAKA